LTLVLTDITTLLAAKNMSTTIQTPFGTALAPAPRHAITVHVPSWQSMLDFVDQKPELLSQLQSMYPRFVLHKDVLQVWAPVFTPVTPRLILLQLVAKLQKFAGLEAQGMYIFPSIQAANDCVVFATSEAREAGAIPVGKISKRYFKTAVTSMFTVVFPPEFTETVHMFWLNPGTGISSRSAEHTLQHLDTLQECPTPATLSGPVEGAAHHHLKQRIADLLNRPPNLSTERPSVTPSDVFFFGTGMAAIYWVHRYLLTKYNATSVLFGTSVHSTIHVLEDFGPGVTFFGNGNASDFDKLSSHISQQKSNGISTQAIWAEFPTNPLLTVPDLHRLRNLADEYDVLLIIDDTISSFVNVDLLSVADILISSLTKSFSGYADLMAGSAVLSPQSKQYQALKSLFAEQHHNDFCILDAEQLLLNSTDYLSRTAILNNNALSLVNFLQLKASDSSSCVKKVFYPTTNATSLQNYNTFLRPATSELQNPGYGCLLSVEFHTLEQTIAFYDNLDVHQGPHLGAHLTIAMPYTRMIYAKELDEATKYGLKPEQIRVSVGLEKTDDLIAVFAKAIDIADRAPMKGTSAQSEELLPQSKT
jgi:cystathionine gamma-synthase